VEEQKAEALSSLIGSKITKVKYNKYPANNSFTLEFDTGGMIDVIEFICPAVRKECYLLAEKRGVNRESVGGGCLVVVKGIVKKKEGD